jgi:P27 family predicted phage terminase small subunit
MRGRKPIPSRLKIIRGNRGKRPINADEPRPAALDVSAPTELSDDVSRAEWARTIVPAILTGQITSADRTAAIAHCELWSTWQSQASDAAQHAHVVKAGNNNYPIPNPARVMANKTLTLLMRVDAELGLTPSSRSRVKTAAPAERSKLERFLHGA